MSNDIPIADDWLDDSSIDEVRKHVKKEIGQIVLTNSDDVFKIFKIGTTHVRKNLAADRN